MPTCYQLIGIPGSGKSTWIKSQTLCDDCEIISTDHFVEEYAKLNGKTYNEVFQQFMPTAVKLMTDDVIQARKKEKDIIWDQTSTSRLSRAKKFRMLPDYKHIAIVFETPPQDILKKRLLSRPGKNIPNNVIQTMLDNWEDPSYDEGFETIVYMKTF